ncbi:hypothetical protein B296_00024799 [Ensete ventricosum]|uniref:Secreted protein n=1 Tax=Ensete ventricosum TaxID=4639 RepID=A0A426ZBP4_ENSVE|nr:hypothetical protein B296_00024799 [Ensete ventricosum]
MNRLTAFLRIVVPVASALTPKPCSARWFQRWGAAAMGRAKKTRKFAVTKKIVSSKTLRNCRLAYVSIGVLIARAYLRRCSLNTTPLLVRLIWSSCINFSIQNKVTLVIVFASLDVDYFT